MKHSTHLELISFLSSSVALTVAIITHVPDLATLFTCVCLALNGILLGLLSKSLKEYGL